MSEADVQLHREMGALGATQQAMLQRLEAIENREAKRDQKLDEVHKVIIRAQGSWKAMVGMGAFGAAIGGLLVKGAALFGWMR